MRDLRSGKELLGAEETKATWWKIDVKKNGEQGLYHENTGVPCEVNFDARGGEGKLSFTWTHEDIRVGVETRLSNRESLARSRIRIVQEITSA